MTPTNRIHDLIFDLSFTDIRADTSAWADWIKAALLPVIDEVIEQQCKELELQAHQLRRIESLELDLGTVLQAESERELVRRLHEQLSNSLRLQLAKVSEQSLLQEQAESVHSEFLHFLKTGQLKWERVSEAKQAHKRLLQEIIKSKTAPLPLQEITRDSRQLGRLLKQFDAGDLFQMTRMALKAWSREEQELMLDWLGLEFLNLQTKHSEQAAIEKLWRFVLPAIQNRVNAFSAIAQEWLESQGANLATLKPDYQQLIEKHTAISAHTRSALMQVVEQVSARVANRVDVIHIARPASTGVPANDEASLGIIKSLAHQLAQQIANSRTAAPNAEQRQTYEYGINELQQAPQFHFTRTHQQGFEQGNFAVLRADWHALLLNCAAQIRSLQARSWRLWLTNFPTRAQLELISVLQRHSAGYIAMQLIPQIQAATSPANGVTSPYLKSIISLGLSQALDSVDAVQLQHLIGDGSYNDNDIIHLTRTQANQVSLSAQLRSLTQSDNQQAIAQIWHQIAGQLSHQLSTSIALNQEQANTLRLAFPRLQRDQQQAWMAQLQAVQTLRLAQTLQPEYALLQAEIVEHAASLVQLIQNKLPQNTTKKIEANQLRQAYLRAFILNPKKLEIEDVTKLLWQVFDIHHEQQSKYAEYLLAQPDTHKLPQLRGLLGLQIRPVSTVRAQAAIPTAVEQTAEQNLKPLVNSPFASHQTTIHPLLTGFRAWQQGAVQLRDLQLNQAELMQYLHWWILHQEDDTKPDYSLLLASIRSACEACPEPCLFLECTLMALQQGEVIDVEALQTQALQIAASTAFEVSIDRGLDSVQLDKLDLMLTSISEFYAGQTYRVEDNEAASDSALSQHDFNIAFQQLIAEEDHTVGAAPTPTASKATAMATFIQHLQSTTSWQQAMFTKTSVAQLQRFVSLYIATRSQAGELTQWLSSIQRYAFRAVEPRTYYLQLINNLLQGQIIDLETLAQTSSSSPIFPQGSSLNVAMTLVTKTPLNSATQARLTQSVLIDFLSTWLTLSAPLNAHVESTLMQQYFPIHQTEQTAQRLGKVVSLLVALRTSLPAAPLQSLIDILDHQFGITPTYWVELTAWANAEPQLASMQQAWQQLLSNFSWEVSKAMTPATQRTESEIAALTHPASWLSEENKTSKPTAQSTAETLENIPTTAYQTQVIAKRLADALLTANLGELEILWPALTHQHADLLAQAQRQYLVRPESRQRLIAKNSAQMLNQMLFTLAPNLSMLLTELWQQWEPVSTVLVALPNVEALQKSSLHIAYDGVFQQSLQQQDLTQQVIFLLTGLRSHARLSSAQDLANSLYYHLQPEVAPLWHQILQANFVLQRFQKAFSQASDKANIIEVDNAMLENDFVRTQLFRGILDYPQLTLQLLRSGSSSFDPGRNDVVDKELPSGEALSTFNQFEQTALLHHCLQTYDPRQQQQFWKSYTDQLSSQPSKQEAINASASDEASNIDTVAAWRALEQIEHSTSIPVQANPVAYGSLTAAAAESHCLLLLQNSHAWNRHEQSYFQYALDRPLSVPAYAFAQLAPALQQQGICERLCELATEMQLQALFTALAPALYKKLPPLLFRLERALKITLHSSPSVLQKSAWRAIYVAQFCAPHTATLQDFTRQLIRQLAKTYPLASVDVGMQKLADYDRGLQQSLIADKSKETKKTNETATVDYPSEPQDIDSNKHANHLHNAGIVIIAPYLQRLFGMLELTKNASFVDHQAADRAVHLLQYIVTGAEATPEFALSLNKLLCGIPAVVPISSGIQMTAQEKEIIQQMLSAIIANWTALGKTSIQGLRETFLAREGHLKYAEDAWQLKIPQGPFDMLLDRLPWSFAMIKFPWMSDPLHVNWR